MSQAILSPSPTNTRSRAFFALVLALLFALMTPGAAAFAQTSPEPTSETAVSWSVRPADSAQGTGRPNFAYELNPGGTLGDALVVTNRSTEPLTLDVYAADGFLTADGSLDILAGAEPSTELGSWVAIDVPQITLASGETTEIPFSVAVPAAAPPGDYAAGIVASMLVTADNGTVTERRLGSRIHLRVLGDLVPALTVSGVTVDYRGTVNPVESGSASVTYTLTNTGNTRLDPDVDVSVAGPFGWAAVSASDDVPDLLPGSSIERTVDVASVLPLAVLTANVTSTASVVSPGVTTDAALPEPVVSSASALTAAVPWTALAILVVVAGLIVWRVIARKRSKVAHQRAIDEAVAAARAERASEETVDAAAPVAAGSSASPGSR
ncbi:DUF916 domain-containing protein [Microbacterium sp. P07]|uniref:DUF916 domain-containing protein n=1 Tax=Microbacterium sp. P07 TaxID=3366952 RepID=UPI003746DB3D